jgi:uncharacterized protein (DUF302 family)
MKYYFEKSTNYSFEKAVERATDELKKEGFGVLTEIDIKETLKKKLEVDFYNYRILGACNPPFAYKALKEENKIGTMLPCNVIIQEHEKGKVEISAVNPVASMMSIENPDLNDIATEIMMKLERVIKNI